MPLASDLNDLAQNVAAQATLPDSVNTLITGLVNLLEAGYGPVQLANAFRSFVNNPDGGQIAVGVLLGQMISRNTSHVAVDLTDPLIPVVQRALRKLRANRAAHIAAINAALDTTEP